MADEKRGFMKKAREAIEIRTEQQALRQAGAAETAEQQRVDQQMRDGLMLLALADVGELFESEVATVPPLQLAQSVASWSAKGWRVAAIHPAGPAMPQAMVVYQRRRFTTQQLEQFAERADADR